LGELDLIYVIRSLILTLAFHLLVSFIPFLMKGELLGFWEYNKQLFVNLLTAGLYSGVLYAGLSIALLAIDVLFKVELPGEIYAKLWVFMAGIFNTWFFLSKFPADFKDLNNQILYPKGLKLFTQYVLLPLVTIYLIILYLYEVKILIEWELPVGWVSYLVIAFSISGILALLLVYPLQKVNKWVSIYTKSFYWALFPLIILFFMAIGKRIIDYGITENRYFLILLALWLLGISIYLLISKLRDIKMIPISLAVISLLSILGPWSAFNISKHSQFSRLTEILAKNKLLENGKIIQLKDTISFEDQKEISSIVSYIVDMHGTDVLGSIFAKPMTEIIDSTTSSYEITNKLLEEMDLKYISRWDQAASNYFSYYYSEKETFEVKGFDYLMNINLYYYSNEDSTYMATTNFGENGGEISLDCLKHFITFAKNSSEVKINLNPLLEGMKKNNTNNSTEIPEELAVILSENEQMKVKIMITNLSLEKKDNDYIITNLTGKLLIANTKE